MAAYLLHRSADCQICCILTLYTLLCGIFIASHCSPEEHVEKFPVVFIKSIPKVELPDNFHTLPNHQQLKAVYNKDAGLYPSLYHHGLPEKLVHCLSKKINKHARYNELKKHNVGLLCPDGTQYECIQDDRTQIVTEFCGPMTECGYRHHYLIILDRDQPHVVKLEKSSCPQGFYSMSCYDKQGCHRDASICLAADGYHWYCNAKGGFCNIHGEIYFTLGNTYERICEHNNTPCANEEEERLNDCSCQKRCRSDETRSENNLCHSAESSDEDIPPVIKLPNPTGTRQISDNRTEHVSESQPGIDNMTVAGEITNPDNSPHVTIKPGTDSGNKDVPDHNRSQDKVNVGIVIAAVLSLAVLILVAVVGAIVYKLFIKGKVWQKITRTNIGGHSIDVRGGKIGQLQISCTNDDHAVGTDDEGSNVKLIVRKNGNETSV